VGETEALGRAVGVGTALTLGVGGDGGDSGVGAARGSWAQAEARKHADSRLATNLIRATAYL
jgi:hypothetical protein